MKKYLKLFFIGFLLLIVFDSCVKVSAEPVEEPVEFERLSTTKIDSYCPESGDPNLVSICGRVTQAMAYPRTLSDGTTSPSVSQVPVKGVSVYLYECDNTSRSCKRDGLLVHPFSSTSTNKDGLFHLVGRKLENIWSHSYPNPYTNDIKKVEETVNIANQSKKRYLVFKCGDYFQGIHIIPSYVDLAGIIHEVNCPKEYLPLETEEFSYVPPLIQFDFIGGVKLAAHMGIEEKEGENYYPTQRAEHTESHTDEQGNVIWDGLETAVQAHYEEYANKKNQSVQVILKGGDPRFTTPDKDTGKRQAIASAATDNPIDFIKSLLGKDMLKDKVPQLGAWYAPDCYIQYSLDPNKGDVDWTEYCELSEEEIYTREDVVTQILLPSLPPKQSLLYYRPLEIRNEISAYYQDQDDLAKFLGSTWANCVGPVYKRIWETDPNEFTTPEYPDCELLRQCNSTINPDSDINVLTANGPAQALMAPGTLKNLEYEAVPHIPVCLIDGEEEPILLSQIQRPGQSCQEYDATTGEGMRLCKGGAYWNNYFLTNLGNNNTSTQFGYVGENKEDSYIRKTTESGEVPKDGKDTNKVPLFKGGDGDRNFQAGAQGVNIGSGDKSGQGSGKAAMHVASGTEASLSSVEATADFLDSPIKNEEVKKDISGGIPYYISSRPVAWGQFSTTNSYPEQIITSKEKDEAYLDDYAFSKEMECESCGKEHYPEDFFEKYDEITIEGGKEGSGARTPFEGNTVTTAAEKRVKEIKKLDTDWQDELDSTLSVATGHSYIDWGMAKMKGKPKEDDLFLQFIKLILRNLFGNQQKTEDKIFVDREPENLIDYKEEGQFKFNDELVAYGYLVNGSNFIELFGCPDGTMPGSWPQPATDEGKKAVSKCYPWHPLDWGESCNTAKLCRNEDLSQTCRVDVCDKGIVKIKYVCESPYNPKVISRETIRTGDCDFSYDCATHQRNTGTPPNRIQVPVDVCPSFSYGPTEYTYEEGYNYCTVSRAGPNQCDGNILFDAEVAVHSQTIYDQDDDNSPKSFNADNIPETGLNLFKAIRDPVSEDIAPLPAAWVSVSSSLSETEPDTSLRKDFPGIGVGTNFLTRAQFGQFNTTSSGDQLEPLYIHCSNSELATEGSWDDGKDCQFATLPEPEIVEIKVLEEELQRELAESEVSDTQCVLREDLTQCEELILGISESGDPLKFSDTFNLILNLAGEKFDVEPAAILLYMHKIGADKEYAHYWSEEGEEDLKKTALAWYDTFSFCDDLEPVKQPPFDWKLTWFYEMFYTTAKPTGTTNSPKGVLNDLLGREATGSRCNFIDSVFTLAGSLARSLVKIEVDSNGDPIYTDIICKDQKWDEYMKNAIKVQYYQLQINWDDELKGELKNDLFSTDNEEYQEIWNWCR